MKTRNKPAEFVTLKIDTQSTQLTPDDIISILMGKDTFDSTNVAVDADAAAMSKQYPNEPIITVYQNGIPTTMSVKQLITDTLISVLGKVAD